MCGMSLLREALCVCVNTFCERELTVEYIRDGECELPVEYIRDESAT